MTNVFLFPSKQFNSALFVHQLCVEKCRTHRLFSNCVFIQCAIHSKFWQSVYFADRTDELYKKNGYRSRKKVQMLHFFVCEEEEEEEEDYSQGSLWRRISFVLQRCTKNWDYLLEAVHCCPHMASRGKCSLKRKLKVLKKKKKWLGDGLNFTGKHVARFSE